VCLHVNQIAPELLVLRVIAEREHFLGWIEFQTLHQEFLIEAELVEGVSEHRLDLFMFVREEHVLVDAELHVRLQVGFLGLDADLACPSGILLVCQKTRLEHVQTQSQIDYLEYALYFGQENDFILKQT